MKRFVLSVVCGFVIPFLYSIIVGPLSSYIENDRLKLLVGIPVRWPLFHANCIIISLVFLILFLFFYFYSSTRSNGPSLFNYPRILARWLCSVIDYYLWNRTDLILNTKNGSEYF